ncbi:MAG TPA: hypothetical protein PKW50_09515 [Syntrophomonas sp.]|nr:hypothetical protein [Syntrophomonas sp.]
MPEYDFAILNMLDRNRRGLTARKYFLDRLAPVFFTPRVEHLIHLDDLGFRGCNVFFPLGPDNWKQMESDQRGFMWKKSESIMHDFAVGSMAADRRLKMSLQNGEAKFPLLFGDNFIKALAAVMVKHVLERRAINKLVMVGEMAELIPLLDHLGGYGLPVSVQNQRPACDEALAWRLLYDKGWAVSNSYIRPENWSCGDLIILFQSGYKRLAMASPGTFWLELNNEGHNLAPSLENALVRVGMDDHLSMLAPILESILYAKAGISGNNVEINGLEFVPEIKNGADLETLIEAGEQLGLWEPFRQGCG